MKKMILDLDTGVDDALAISYALGSPEVELIGITGTYGNVLVEQGVRNALAVTDLLGHPEVKVYQGLSHSSTTDHFEVLPVSAFIHGDNGIGDVDIPDSNRSVETESAVDFIIDAVKTYGKDLIYVPTGPMTNIEAALKKAPEIKDEIGRVVLMGGALTVPGNCNACMEANISQDPEAADYLFRSGTPTTMIGLDVTLQTLLTYKETQQWRDLGTKAGKFLADILLGRESPERCHGLQHLLPGSGAPRAEGREQCHGTLRKQPRFGLSGRSGARDARNGRRSPCVGRFRGAGGRHQGGVGCQRGRGRGCPRGEQGGKVFHAAEQGEGTLLRHLGVEKPPGPEGKFVGRDLCGIRDVERREAQFAHLLEVEVAGESVVATLGPRQRAERRKAHAVVQSAGAAVETHRIGHGAVTLAAKGPEQRRHAGGMVHRLRTICAWEAPRGSYVRIRRSEARRARIRCRSKARCTSPDRPRGT